MRRFLKLAVLVIPLFAIGCGTYVGAHVHLSCKAGVPENFTLQGSNVGNQVLAAGLSAASAAGFAGKASAAAPQVDDSTLDYSWWPIFGSDGGSLSCGATPAPNTTINVAPGATINMPATK